MPGLGKSLLYCFSMMFFMYVPAGLRAQKVAYFQSVIYNSETKDGFFANSFVQLADKGFMMVGQDDSDIFMVCRTDSLGRPRWLKKYENGGLYTGYEGKIIITPDSNFVFCGQTPNIYNPYLSTETAYLSIVKIDKNGKIIWNRTYGDSANAEYPYDIINDPNGGLLVTGGMQTAGGPNNLLALKLDNNGNLVWSNLYTGYTGYDLLQSYRIGNYPGGGYVIMGWCEHDSVNGTSGTIFLKIDESGNLKWAKIYGDTLVHNEPDEFYQLAVLPDKSIYAYGYTEDGAHLVHPGDQKAMCMVKLDSNGKYQWSKSYGSGEYLDNAEGFLYSAALKGFYITDYTVPNINSTQEYGFGTINLNGVLKYLRIYPRIAESGFDDYIYNGCIVEEKHGVALLGNAFPSGSVATCIIRADSTGNTNNCGFDIDSIIYRSYTLSALSFPVHQTQYNMDVDSGMKVTSLTAMVSSYCPPFLAGFGWQGRCAENPIKFSDSTYQYPTSWAWNFGDSTSKLNKASTQNPTHIYLKPGSYTVRLISSNGTDTDTAFHKITILPSPIIFSLDTMICKGATATLRASGGQHYLWQPGSAAKDSSDTFVVSPKLTTKYLLQSAYNNGCMVDDTFKVSVDSNPGPPLILNATVISYGGINLIFRGSDSGDVSTYTILRSEDSGAYIKIGTVSRNNTNLYTYTDKTVSANNHRFSYEIVGSSPCGQITDTSGKQSPALLKGLGGDLRVSLTWAKYKGEAIDSQAVQRYDTLTQKWITLGYISKTDSAYTDSTYIKCNKPVNYRIASFLNDSQVSYSDSVMAIPYETYFRDTPQIITVTKTVTSTTNGIVIIRWKNNNTHVTYNDLYYAPDGINFSLLQGHIPAGQDSFVHTGVNTQTADEYYSLVATDSCPAKSAKSLINKTMTLTVSIGELLHKLNWTPYQGFKVEYYVVEKLIGNNFQPIDSVLGVDTFTRFFPAPCNHIERYRIQAVGYNSGEISWSDTMGRKALDTIPPDPPIMQNASVLSGNSAEINFIGSDSLDTYEFAIQHSVDGNWGTVGTILFTKPGALLAYIDNGVNTAKNNLCYTVIAIDSCLNATPSDTFCLIKLQGNGVQMSDSLYWSPFKGYGLTDYAILTLNQSGKWDTLGRVNPEDTDYFNSNVKCSQAITYKIEGKEKSGNEVTLSDSITLTPFDTVKPIAPEFYYVTVLPNQTVKLSWQWNPKSIEKYFEIWRSTNRSAPVLIDTVIYDSVYIDTHVNVKSNIYSYSVIAIDSCNTSNRSKPSQTDSLMLLSLYSLYCTPQVQVHWTKFTGLPNGVSSYSILRSTDGVNFTSIGSVNASTTMFIDNNVTLGQQYYYKTEAIDSKSGYVSYSDTLGIIPRLIPLADSAQLVYATVLKSDETHGEIYIQWKRAALNDTNARGYYVYSYNTANGKYALLQNITNLNDTNYIQENINTIQDAYKYYIVTYNVCDVGINSNIHRTVLLTVQNNNLEEQLNWTNYMGIPVKNYSVYKSEDGGPQYLVNSAGLDSAYYDSNVVCNHNFTYQIQAILANGEISFSDSITVKSFDTVRPVTEPILLATVVRTGIQDGRILLDWNPAFDKELAGYNIYRSEDGLYWSLVIDHWPGTSLIDTGLDTYDQPYYYKIQPVDSCGNFGNFTIYHETMQLKASAGNGFNELSWNGYAGWMVQKYLVYRNGVLIDTVANNVFSFKDTAVICQNVYQYLIKAIDSVNDTIISASNIDSARATNNIPPQKVYIKTVTVSSPNKAATISWTPSPSYDVKNYFIFRKSPTSGTMTFVDSTTNLSYIDSNHINVPPLGAGGLADEGDCYYVFARDHCGNQSDGSNQGCIIILSATNQQGYNQLTWNSYQDWYDGVQGYNVYENSDSTGWQLIGTTSPPAPLLKERGAFTDSKLGDSVINFCYQVEAIENPGQYNQLSRSTVVCVHQDATVFIPNSFTPYNQDGLNDYFGPIGSYIKSYDMKIYNRWGELLYNTVSGKAWDGTFQGQFVQQGVYIYLITITDYNGKQSYFKGTITMFE